MELAQVEEHHRRSNDIGKAPDNPANRMPITLQQPPHDQNFPDTRVVKVINHNCMDGWPSLVLTWAEQSQAFKTRAWEDFTARFTWDASIDAKVKELYARKCAERTKGKMNTARSTATRNAEKVYPGHGPEHMHEFNPWWCTKEIWAEMCQKWRGDQWARKSQVASANRASGTPPGQRAMGTYKGGTKSQVQYLKEAQSPSAPGTQTNWRELYMSLRVALPRASAVSEQYGHLMDEKYPDASSRPGFDENLWVAASGGPKKGYVKGLGFKRSRPSSFTCTSGSSSVGGSTATSAAPTTQESHEDLVRAMCSNQNLMDMLSEALLSRMSTEQISQHLIARAQTQGADDDTQAPPPPGNEGH